MSISSPKPHCGREHRQRRLHVDARVAGADGQRIRLGRRQPGQRTGRRPAVPTPARTGRCRPAPRCRRRGSAARRPPGRARRSRWRRRRRPRGLTGLRRQRSSGPSRLASRLAPCRPAQRDRGSATRLGAVSDLLLRPVAELAELVRSGELSARELVELSLRRIEELDPTINAFTHVASDAALAIAGEIGPGDPRPFAGVPIAIKDNRPVEGMPLTMGSDIFGDLVPRHDAFLVRRVREAGFVIVGKTSLPEVGLLPTTEPRRFGPTRNPWDLERTPGGSSGGSAAAVAAGMVPIAHGNDGGGSIRIPAACCGLVGLKPARGRVSVGPEVGDSFARHRRHADAHGRRDRRAARRAGRLRGRRRDVGADLRTERSPSPPPRPGHGESALALNPPLPDATVDPVCRAGRARRGGAARVARPQRRGDRRRRGRTRSCCRCSPALFGPMVALTVSARRPPGRTRAPARRRRAADLGAVRAGAPSRLDRVPGGTEPSCSRPRGCWSEFLSPYDAVITPALAQRQLLTGAGARARSRPLGPLPPLRAVHAVHRDLQRDRVARGVAAAVSRATTACRWACR